MPTFLSSLAVIRLAHAIMASTVRRAIWAIVRGNGVMGARSAEGLRHTALACMQGVHAEVLAPLTREHPGAVLITDSWSNDAGSVLAYVSYFPSGNASEESIDAVLDLRIGGDGVSFSAELSRSDGEIVSEVVKSQVIGYGLAFDERFAELCRMARGGFVAELIALRQTASV